MKAEDPSYRVFGADAHKYRLGSVLPERKIREFEEKHRVRLPSDYRHFLTAIGNGVGMYGKKKYDGEAGAGPDYGLTPFRIAAKYCTPGKPFLWKPSDAGAGWIDSGRASRDEWGEDRPHGLVQLCEQGCTGYFYLVVNGESYGTVWERWEYNLRPTGLPFEEWYSHWLHHLIQTAIPILRCERVIEQVRVGMSKTEIVAVCGGEWTQDQYDPVWKYSMLSSPDFVTKFYLDADDNLERMVKYSISFPLVR